jgi:hypothetical protein
MEREIERKRKRREKGELLSIGSWVLENLSANGWCSIEISASFSRIKTR